MINRSAMQNVERYIFSVLVLAFSFSIVPVKSQAQAPARTVAAGSCFDPSGNQGLQLARQKLSQTIPSDIANSAKGDLYSKRSQLTVSFDNIVAQLSNEYAACISLYNADAAHINRCPNNTSSTDAQYVNSCNSEAAQLDQQFGSLQQQTQNSEAALNDWLPGFKTYVGNLASAPRQPSNSALQQAQHSVAGTDNSRATRECFETASCGEQHLIDVKTPTGSTLAIPPDAVAFVKSIPESARKSPNVQAELGLYEKMAHTSGLIENELVSAKAAAVSNPGDVKAQNLVMMLEGKSKKANGDEQAAKSRVKKYVLDAEASP